MRSGFAVSVILAAIWAGSVLPAFAQGAGPSPGATRPERSESDAARGRERAAPSGPQARPGSGDRERRPEAEDQAPNSGCPVNERKLELIV